MEEKQKNLKSESSEDLGTSDTYKVDPEEVARMQKLMRVRQYAKMVAIFAIGMLVALGGAVTYKYVQKERVEDIVETCAVYSKGTMPFYCCLGCIIQEFNKFSYIQDSGTCICGDDKIIWDGIGSVDQLNVKYA